MTGINTSGLYNPYQQNAVRLLEQANQANNAARSKDVPAVSPVPKVQNQSNKQTPAASVSGTATDMAQPSLLSRTTAVSPMTATTSAQDIQSATGRVSAPSSSTQQQMSTSSAATMMASASQTIANLGKCCTPDGSCKTGSSSNTAFGKTVQQSISSGKSSSMSSALSLLNPLLQDNQTSASQRTMTTQQIAASDTKNPQTNAMNASGTSPIASAPRSASAQAQAINLSLGAMDNARTQGTSSAAVQGTNQMQTAQTAAQAVNRMNSINAPTENAAKYAVQVGAGMERAAQTAMNNQNARANIAQKVQTQNMAQAQTGVQGRAQATTQRQAALQNATQANTTMSQQAQTASNASTSQAAQSNRASNAAARMSVTQAAQTQPNTASKTNASPAATGAPSTTVQNIQTASPRVSGNVMTNAQKMQNAVNKTAQQMGTQNTTTSAGMRRQQANAASTGATAAGMFGVAGTANARGVLGATGTANAAGTLGAADNATQTVQGMNGSGKVSPSECQTCAERKYQDGSNDPGVSFKTAQHISPQSSSSVVRGHEQEHVTRNQAKAKREGREVVSQSVVMHTAICPECGTSYVSGGTTTTVTRAAQDNTQKQQQSQQNAQNAQQTMAAFAMAGALG